MKMKKAAVLVLAMILTMAAAVPTFAAGVDGWALENGQPVYYLNGSKVTSTWVSNGDACYYVNSLGYASPEWVISNEYAVLAGVPVINGTGLATDTQAVINAAQAAVVPSMNITVDYATSSQADIARYEDNLYRRHSYGVSYEYFDEENDKAYCYCGEWALVPHAWEHDDEGERCANCNRLK